MTRRTFTGTLGGDAQRGGRWVEVPFDVREAFGEARPPVRGTVNGSAVRSRLAVYGGRTYLGLTKAVRQAAGIELGDAVEVVLERDDGPREVDVPAELDAVLAAEPPLRATYDALAFTHRREYATWVGSAKREPTRARRAAKAAEMLRAGVRHP